MLPGYGEQMRAISLKYVPTAVLSRQTAGEPSSLVPGLCSQLQQLAIALHHFFILHFTANCV
jgi:molybdopterin biosynthesis enzyme MoaB